MIDDLLSRDVLWQMSLAERAAVVCLLDRLHRKCVAIEVGTYRGGFLRVLSGRFRHVYSLDTDHSQVVDPESFRNVTWVPGDSRETLPALIDRLNQDAKSQLGLVLIDGDHTQEAVLRDIAAVLAYRPRADVVVLLHDSWYGPTREAINQAPWAQCQYVHLVEKDLVPGDVAGDVLVGGLGLALLRPQPRDGPLEIGQSQDLMYRLCRSAVARP